MLVLFYFIIFKVYLKERSRARASMLVQGMGRGKGENPKHSEELDEGLELTNCEIMT